MKIGYIVHNLNDPAVERRCIMLERGGASIALAGFCRDVKIVEAVKRRAPKLLGQSADAAFVQRALNTLKNTFANSGLRNFFADCDVILARNLEQLAIASNLAGERPIVYECLDIHRSLVGNGVAAKAVQFVEGRLLPRTDLLLTSSPAFMREHFDHRPLNAPAELIENKLLVADGDVPKRLQADLNQPIRIGWFGMLRCSQTFAFLTELLARADGRIEVLVCGKPSTAELPEFAQRVEQVPGMIFTGPYSYSDLPALYGQCHFAWTIDWFEEGLNSSWLLPNRLYEALSHGAIPIALADIELGHWLAEHGVGFRAQNPEHAMERLLSFTAADLAAMQAEVMQVAESDVVADTGDCCALVEMISRVKPR